MGKFLGGNKTQQQQQQQGADVATAPQAQVPGQEAAVTGTPTHAVAGWPVGLPLAMHVHLSTSPTGDVFSGKWTSGHRKDRDAGLPSFVWNNITLGDWNEKRIVEFNVNLPEVRATETPGCSCREELALCTVDRAKQWITLGRRLPCARWC